MTRFHGWARMALPLHAFNVIEVKPPRVGEVKPAAVTADIILDTARAFALLQPVHFRSFGLCRS